MNAQAIATIEQALLSLDDSIATARANVISAAATAPAATFVAAADAHAALEARRDHLHRLLRGLRYGA